MILGISGNVILDAFGDREPDYWITDMDPTDGSFVKIAEVLNTDNGERVNINIFSTPFKIDSVSIVTIYFFTNMKI